MHIIQEMVMQQPFANQEIKYIQWVVCLVCLLFIRCRRIIHCMDEMFHQKQLVIKLKTAKVCHHERLHYTVQTCIVEMRGRQIQPQTESLPTLTGVTGIGLYNKTSLYYVLRVYAHCVDMLLLEEHRGQMNFICYYLFLM